MRKVKHNITAVAEEAEERYPFPTEYEHQLSHFIFIGIYIITPVGDQNL